MTTSNLSERNKSALHWKLMSAHQAVLQGLQAYRNHLPSSISTGVVEKLRELLVQSLELCDVHKTHETEGNREIFEVIDVSAASDSVKCFKEDREETGFD